MKIKGQQLFAAVSVVVILAIAGCSSSPQGEGGNSSMKLSTSVPMQALNAMYNSRSAMIRLADGSAEDPAAEYGEMVKALPDLRTFHARIEKLSDSFNDADYLYFWDQLAAFGSLYQINTGGLSANRLRQMELSLRSFETDVHTLERVYGDYLSYLEKLHELADAANDPTVLQQYVPLVNAITEKTVELEVLIKDFSEDLFGISRSLRSAI